MKQPLAECARQVNRVMVRKESRNGEIHRAICKSFSLFSFFFCILANERASEKDKWKKKKTNKGKKEVARRRHKFHIILDWSVKLKRKRLCFHNEHMRVLCKSRTNRVCQLEILAIRYGRCFFSLIFFSRFSSVVRHARTVFFLSFLFAFPIVIVAALLLQNIASSLIIFGE